MKKLIDPEFDSLSILHLAHEGGDDFYFKEDFDHEEFLEREQLIMTSKDVAIVATQIKLDKPIDNEISDWELVTIEITAQADAYRISHSSAWENIRDWAYEIYHFGHNGNYNYLAYL